MSDVTSVIEKVKRLLALSQSSNANESAAAMAAANRLIDAYRLEMTDIEGQDDQVSEPIEEDPDFLYESGKMTNWRRALAMKLCSHYGVALWNDATWSTGRKISRYRMVGKRSDMGIVRYLYVYLTTEIERLSAKEARGMGRVFSTSYCDGFVHGIGEQLKASRTEVQQQATSQAIIKVDARLEESKSEMYRLHTNLKTVKHASYARHDASAYAVGQIRGKSTHLGQSLGSGGTKMLGK
jgi:hypothetical protein